jgi:hypothetical protein
METGLFPTVMVSTTVFVAWSITDTQLLFWFTTCNLPVLELKAIPIGKGPTGMLATTNPGDA